MIRRPAQGEKSEIDDAEFAPGKYNVYVFSDLPADYLTPKQHKLLVEAVRKGAGFMMLGGHSSFGAGGWADTPVAEILPAAIHPGDGQLEPEEGIKFVPNAAGLDSYILQVGANRAETEQDLGLDAADPGHQPLRRAEGVGQRPRRRRPAPDAEPLMLSMDVGTGPRRSPTAAKPGSGPAPSEEGRLAHRKFWRQSSSGSRTRRTTAKTRSS